MKNNNYVLHPACTYDIFRYLFAMRVHPHDYQHHTRLTRNFVSVCQWVWLNHTATILAFTYRHFGRYQCHACYDQYKNTRSNTHTRLTALFPGLPRWAGTRKAKPNWILLKQETVSGSGISWVVCKSAPRSRQITMPAPHHSVFYKPDALPAAQPTASKHWRDNTRCNSPGKYRSDFDLEPVLL